MLKVGILGAGFMGGTHAAAFAGLPDVQIVGISSRSAEKAATLAAKYGAEPFADAFALATDPRVDVISNTLPTQLHKDLTIAALKAGKHVLVEKPMALSVAECDEMIAAAKQNGRLLMVAHVLRFWPEYVAIADFLKTGALGKPWPRPPNVSSARRAGRTSSCTPNGRAAACSICTSTTSTR